MVQGEVEAREVGGHQGRDAEAQHKLRRFRPREAKIATLVKGPESEAHMGREGRVENDGAWQSLPNLLLDDQSGFRRGD
jgi:hypothetical protein